MPIAGIAAVAVRPEHRGSGLLAPLFAALLADARERGAVVSTLFPTAPGIYRRLGYEVAYLAEGRVHLLRWLDTFRAPGAVSPPIYVLRKRAAQRPGAANR